MITDWIRLPFPLIPAMKDYAWGMRAATALAAVLSGRPNPGNGPFAELWYGSHPSGPATARFDSGEFALDELCRRFPMEILGGAATPPFQMPFQGKILSIDDDGEPLSIQLHPPKHRARLLAASKPSLYPDPHEKDEASFALLHRTELLCGFREDFGMLPPELVRLFVGQPNPDPKSACAMLMGLEPDDVTKECRRMFLRLRQKQEPLTSEEEWVLKLEPIYPDGDVGLFYIFLLNLIRLEPGKSVAIPVGRFHAYLRGQFAEIMKPGDCVVRLGFTPKAKDLEEVIHSGEFTRVNATSAVQSSVRHSDGRIRHDFDQFGLRIDRFDQPGSYYLRGSGQPMIVLCLSGDGSLHTQHTGGTHRSPFAEAGAYLVPACLPLTTLELRSGDVLCYRMS